MPPAVTADPATDRPRAWERTTLLVLLLLALATRTIGLDAVPPGLNQDEAANAWNAWCLLHTGHDQVGDRWPIFCFRALGEYRSTLFLYFLLPIQALGGLGVWTTRLPSALVGALTVYVLYRVAARLCDRPVGLLAAGLLAINPVHIQLSRMGHEASLAPLFTLLPVGLLLWAGLPPARPGSVPRPGRALVAGLLTGIGCYGYPSIRLFVPLLLAAVVLVTPRQWWATIKDRSGRWTIAAWLIGWAATFGPLAVQHVVAGDTIGRRGQMTWIWDAEDPPATRVAKVAQRYAAHFHPDFLYQTGDHDEVVWTVGRGFVPQYTLPLQIVGLVVLLRRTPRDGPARLLLAGVLLFPVADSLNWHISLHNLRTSAGLVYLLLPAAIGAAAIARYLAQRRTAGWLVAYLVALVGMTIPETTRFAHAYLFQRPGELTVHLRSHTDLLAAAQRLRPELDAIDALVVTPWEVNQPYLIVLVGLDYPPQRWFEEPMLRETRPLQWDRYVRCGPLWFPNPAERDLLLAQLALNRRADRVLLLLRPDEPRPCAPRWEIPGPGSEPTLVVCDCWL
jgi:4-amino-4-deoxy-L-arabinose transferase-like glycosyltransferase